MKKNYFLLAASTMMFAACAQNDLVNEVVTEETPQAIGFETFVNKVTRAENSGQTYSQALNGHHETFKVWAGKILATGTFVDVYAKNAPGTVTWTSGTWKADPVTYWDKAASNYYFYAAAPAKDASGNSIAWSYTNSTDNDGSTGYLSLSTYTLTGVNGVNSGALTSNWKNKADIDLMISDNVDLNPVSSYTSPVGLSFIHILSKLNIMVKSTAGNNVVLTKLDVVGLKATGNFDENATLPTGTTLAGGTSARWTASGSYNLEASLPSSVLSTEPTYTHEYLIIPQLVKNVTDTNNKGTAPTGDVYLHIQYTVNGEPYETYYSLAAAFGISKDGNLAFNEGWQNTLTINIAPNDITFSGMVASWADGTTKDNTTIQ